MEELSCCVETTINRRHSKRQKLRLAISGDARQRMWTEDRFTVWWAPSAHPHVTSVLSLLQRLASVKDSEDSTLRHVFSLIYITPPWAESLNGLMRSLLSSGEGLFMVQVLQAFVWKTCRVISYQTARWRFVFKVCASPASRRFQSSLKGGQQKKTNESAVEATRVSGASQRTCSFSA